jgi:transposase-like protein
MSKKRRYFTAEQKVTSIRKHLIEKMPVSDICEDLNISSTQFYKWQTEFFENGSKAFTKENNSQLKKSSDKNASLESDVIQKNGVIAELVEENIRLKKGNGLI